LYIALCLWVRYQKHMTKLSPWKVLHTIR